MHGCKLLWNLPLLSLLFPLIAASLSGCAGPMQTAEINTSKISNPAVCRALKPVKWSVDDTKESIDGMRRNNAALAKACRK